MTINEVSKQYDLTPDTLRYYERVGIIPKVRRGSGGNRDYSEADCRWVDFAKCMRSAGIQVEALVAYMALFQGGDKTIDARKAILCQAQKALKERIEKMTATLEKLTYKIDNYEQVLVAAEDQLAIKENE